MGIWFSGMILFFSARGLEFVEFAYNIVIDSTIHCFPLKDVYGFNPFKPLVLLVIPSNIFVSEAAQARQI